MTGCPDPTYAYIDPEQGYACGATVDPAVVVKAASCIAELEVDSFGQTDIQSLIVFGMNVFGGPTVVLPRRDPVPPRPGPPPEPTPR